MKIVYNNNLIIKNVTIRTLVSTQWVKGSLVKLQRVYLLGRFDVVCVPPTSAAFHARKVQELLAYLLLHRTRPHTRESLAEMLWKETSSAQSRKYLRQALWQLQGGTGPSDRDHVSLLVADSETIAINRNADLWLDVDIIEQAYEETRGTQGIDIDDQQAQALKRAVELYRGDLLEGWYSDWCLYERERLQNIILAVLDKLLNYYEKHQQYEMCLVYGEAILRIDHAHERTHRHLIRIRYLLGDRTGALRQYERCVLTLKEELDVSPSRLTTALYEQVRSDHPDLRLMRNGSLNVADMMRQIQSLESALKGIQEQLYQFAAYSSDETSSSFAGT